MLYDFVGVNKKIFGRDINKEFRKIQNEFRKNYLYKFDLSLGKMARWVLNGG